MDPVWIEIFDQMVGALVNGKCPDFSSFEKEEVRRAYEAVLYKKEGEWTINFYWFHTLKERIRNTSWGFLFLEEILQESEWPCLPVKKPVQYLKLIDAKSRKVRLYFYICSGDNPVQAGEVTPETLAKFI